MSIALRRGHSLQPRRALSEEQNTCHHFPPTSCMPLPKASANKSGGCARRSEYADLKCSILHSCSGQWQSTRSHTTIPYRVKNRSGCACTLMLGWGSMEIPIMLVEFGPDHAIRRMKSDLSTCHAFVSCCVQTPSFMSVNVAVVHCLCAMLSSPLAFSAIMSSSSSSGRLVDSQ